MNTAASFTSPLAFLELLLDHIDPHQSTRSEQSLTDQVACARWLALRRLELGQTALLIANRIGVSAQDLRLLEAGVATPELLSAAALAHLCRELASQQRPATWVTHVCDLARGVAIAQRDTVMQTVLRDIEQVIGSEEPETEQIATPVAETKAETPTRPSREQVQKHLRVEPGFCILDLLAPRATAMDAYQLWQAYQDYAPISETRLAVLLRDLSTKDFVRWQPETRQYAITEPGRIQWNRVRHTEDRGYAPEEEIVPAPH